MQLEQAIGEAHSQHKRLKEQAANVIANQKQSEIRLNKKMEELTKLNGNARQALIMASDAEKAGDADKATQYTHAAETIADRLISVEADVESLKTMVLESTQASDQAKAAVKQNSRLLQEKIAEKSKLMSQLDQAQMQEEMNSAMASLTETVGDDVPTFNEVQEKIEARLREGQGVGRTAGGHASRAVCSRSSRPRRTWQPRAVCPSCAPSSDSTPLPRLSPSSPATPSHSPAPSDHRTGQTRHVTTSPNGSDPSRDISPIVPAQRLRITERV